jgi:hypothetical protein
VLFCVGASDDGFGCRGFCGSGGEPGQRIIPRAAIDETDRHSKRCSRAADLLALTQVNFERAPLDKARNRTFA